MRVLPSWRVRWPLWLSVAVIPLVTACGSAPKAPVLDAARVQRFEAQGYPAVAPVPVSEIDDIVFVDGLPARLVWAWPQSSGPHPVVLYMPGLGQGPHAMAAWRQALAQAGHVVVSWQVLGEDEAAVQGDPFHLSPRFGLSSLQQRVSRVTALLAGWRQQGLAVPGVSPAWGVADLDHMAVVGYELGAQTAQALAGEAVSGLRRPADAAQALVGVQAWMLISPYASFGAGALDTRFRGLTQPVMVMTSDADDDPTGLVASPHLRTAAYAGLGAADKAMLLLHGAGHGDLGQRERHDAMSGLGSAPGGLGRPGGGDEAAPGGGAGGRGGRAGGPGGGKGGPGGAAGGPRGGDADGNASLASPTISPTLSAMQAQAWQGVSLAFLDAHVRGDALAQRWLSQSVGRWVAPVGEWLTASSRTP